MCISHYCGGSCWNILYIHCMCTFKFQRSLECYEIYPTSRGNSFPSLAHIFSLHNISTLTFHQKTWPFLLKGVSSAHLSFVFITVGLPKASFNCCSCCTSWLNFRSTRAWSELKLIKCLWERRSDAYTPSNLPIWDINSSHTYIPLTHLWLVQVQKEVMFGCVFQSTFELRWNANWHPTF